MPVVLEHTRTSEVLAEEFDSPNGYRACVARLEERIVGNDEVKSSTLFVGSMKYREQIPEKDRPMPEVPRPRGHKNRKRWCGGHEGREHDWGEWSQPYPQWIWYPKWVERQCKRCCKKEYGTSSKSSNG